MRSDELHVTMKNLGPTLAFIERTTAYIGYDQDFSARIRLLGEELMRSVSFILSETGGTLWLDTDEENMYLHLKMEGSLSDDTRDKLIDISKTQRNEPPKGLFKRIGAYFADAFMSDAAGYVPYLPEYGGFRDGYMPMSMLLEAPMAAADARRAAAPPQDEYAGMEESILKGLADDIKVCARISYAEMVVVKKLPQKAEQKGA